MSFFKKLKEAISNIVSGKKNQEINNITDLLIEADFGVTLAESLSNKIKNSSNTAESLKEEISNLIKFD